MLEKLSIPISAESMIMLPLAIILDTVGEILLPGILNVLVVILIILWMNFRPKKSASSKKEGFLEFLRKIFQGKWKRFLTPLIGEAFSFGILPCLTLAVYFELTS